MLKIAVFYVPVVLALIGYAVSVDDCEFEKHRADDSIVSKPIEALKHQVFTALDESGGYKYLIGVCHSVVDGDKVGVLQTELAGEKRNTIVGRIDASDIMHGKDWVMLTYENGDPYRGHCKGNGSGLGEKRRAQIMFVCDEGASDVKALQPRVVEEMNNKTMDCFYLFEINTNVVCETRPLITIGLSTGTILIIVFLCVATFYLLAGVIYKRVMLKAKGLEQIPNIDFWKDFGNLEADGCDLVCRSRGARKPREYKGIADAQLDEPDFTANHDDGLLPM